VSAVLQPAAAPQAIPVFAVKVKANFTWLNKQKVKLS